MKHPTDPRDMRKALQDVSRGYPVPGKPHPNAPDLCSHLVRNCMHAGQYNGFSGEDTMTMLAYHLLVECERLSHVVIQGALINPISIQVQVADHAT